MTWRLPPRWVRRVVLAPGIVVVAVLLVPTSLLLVIFLLGALAWLVPGRLRVPRMLWMASFYILWDAAVILAAFGLWLASGFGLLVHRPGFLHAHYRLADRMLTVLFWQVRWTLRLDIDVVDADLGVVLTGTPVVVASRHAGPGDSFILVHALLSWFDREPRIVLKDTLQWDPAIDILLNRLPAQFVTPRASRRDGAAGGSDAVGRLAEDLGPRDALLIFPEGGNVTPRRRLARIEALRSAGRHRLAADAEQMQHVMAPHSGGILSALDEAPQAGVVFVAHTGLDRLVTVADIWRELPMDKRIVMKGWSVPPDEVPRERAAQEEWLFASWLRIDEWISDNEVPAAAPARVPPVAPDAPVVHTTPDAPVVRAAPDASGDVPPT
ncbi:hypothetical protein Cch01nite_26330 [Cellulomonas chitinilytica]|uniref:Phospholipid/glycerol acyltransferase domain-containing protein n=1 Tax=Cellulomonas chitinilytica TaxID=398759 RepID=A0A919U391_9CELL|nr:1-acyl-sn-glycerol-3-phosphate acyltransferase [Cellulomonas chitinilytica]GIG21909.1 hypothetical protein Cch01nite_26330 [Cellulomonas chitinilytica]